MGDGVQEWILGEDEELRLEVDHRTTVHVQVSEYIPGEGPKDPPHANTRIEFTLASIHTML